MTDSPKDIISSLMYVKDRPATIKDFDLEDVKWDRHYFPHDLMNLRKYHQQLHWENMVQGMVTNQVIPSIGYITRMMEETGLSDELLEKYVWAGGEIQEFLEIAYMEPDEREEYFEWTKTMHEDLLDTSDPDGFGAMIANGITQVRKQEAETEELKRMFEGD